MKTRADELIRLLKLKPHPEGGFFAEVFRSPKSVRAAQGKRSAITTIYFLLRRGEVSRWHRVASDEIWHFIEGSPLRLHCVSADFSRQEIFRVGPVRGKSQAPIAVISAGGWQAAESSGDFSLVACDVGPGFDFADFLLLRGDSAAGAAMARRFAGAARFV